MKQVKNKTWAALLAFGLIALSGWAYAQTDTTVAEEMEAIEAEVKGLSTEEKLNQAVTKIDAMKGTLGETTGLLDRVRTEEQDILKLNCINEKLAAMKGFVKVSEQSYGNLKDAASEKDDDKAVHHFKLISIAGQRVEGLGQEALVCAGETLRYSGDFQRTVEVDPEIADVDAVNLAADRYVEDYINARLPELTPYQ